MLSIRCFLALIACAAVGHAAEDWQPVRFEGRDYIPLDNIARFYGFPPPPPVVATLPPAAKSDSPAAPSSPAPTTKPDTSSGDGTTEAESTAPPQTAPAEVLKKASAQPPVPLAEQKRADTEIMAVALEAAPTKTVNLASDKAQLTLTANSREARINGVKQWLAFPTIVQDGKMLVSRLDLAKTIEPRLRPEKIAGLSPVRTVVLDAGHGGHDKGAGSRYGFEKNFALDIARRVKEKLERRGLRVLMTRASDVFIPLHERPRVANNTKDSIFVSIHFNAASSNPLARGFEIYSLAPRGAPATNDGAFNVRHLREEIGNPVDTHSTLLAGSIHHAMLGQVPMEDRGMKHARFAVLRLCNKPSVLIECGFVSNGPEAALIGSPAWRQSVADSIAAGIENYKELAEERHAPKLVADYRKASLADPDKPAEPAPVEQPQQPQKN